MVLTIWLSTCRPSRNGMDLSPRGGVFLLLRRFSFLGRESCDHNTSIESCCQGYSDCAAASCRPRQAVVWIPQRWRVSRMLLPIHCGEQHLYTTKLWFTTKITTRTVPRKVLSTSSDHSSFPNAHQGLRAMPRASILSIREPSLYIFMIRCDSVYFHGPPRHLPGSSGNEFVKSAIVRPLGRRNQVNRRLCLYLHPLRSPLCTVKVHVRVPCRSSWPFSAVSPECRNEATTTYLRCDWGARLKFEARASNRLYVVSLTRV